MKASAFAARAASYISSSVGATESPAWPQAMFSRIELPKSTGSCVGQVTAVWRKHEERRCYRQTYLLHKSHRVAQVAQIPAANVETVDEDSAGLHVVETQQEEHERRLSCGGSRDARC